MKAAKIITYCVLVLLFVAVCGFIFYYTGGFTSDFKTFYVNIDGKDILTSADGYKLSADTPLQVNVKYTFGALNKDIMGYSVKVVPNVAGKDFDFTVDGQTYSYQTETDLTAGFDISQEENSFTITPKGGINKILAAIYPESEIEDCRNKTYENMYSLVVTSYNGAASVEIHFSIDEPLYDIVLDKEEIVF